MEFLEFRNILDAHITNLIFDQSTLYVTDTDKDELWNLYLDSFPEGTNKVYRERREYDCSCCRSFIKNFGNVVVVKNGQKISIWDFKTGDTTFQPVIDALSKYVKSKDICNVFLTKETSFGTLKSFENPKNGGNVIEYDHYYIKVPTRFVIRSTDSVDTVLANIRSTKDVFKRSLEEISLNSVDTVLELIAQKSLYKGEEWQSSLSQFRKLKSLYSNISDKDMFCWDEAGKVGIAISKIKNHSIGVLLMDIAEGVDLDIAVRKYEKIVAPTNYKRPKAIFTKAMIEDAQKMIEELGLASSLGRKYASIDDISINNILFANRDSKKAITGIFDELKQEAVSNQKFDKLEEVSIETFVKDIVPSLTSIEAYVENKHSGNLMSLISASDMSSKTLFKWNNNFSWAYNSNITDSMKERVKNAGGKVDGALRFSIQWNEDKNNSNDFDAHCVEPNGNIIYFASKKNLKTGGNLDVDIIHPSTEVAVENITWPSREKMLDGMYTFMVHNFTQRNGRDGFSAEIEYNGNTYSYEYRKPIRNNEKVIVARVKITGNDIEFIESLPSTVSSKKIWGLNSQNFQPVSLFMFSPNYWDEQQGIGNKHYFFILKDCINDTSPNGFFNEFLKEDFMKHKRVFEALGSKMKVEDSANQLSGLGFSSTKRDSLICKVTGKFTRVIKINF